MILVPFGRVKIICYKNFQEKKKTPKPLQLLKIKPFLSQTPPRPSSTIPSKPSRVYTIKMLQELD